MTGRIGREFGFSGNEKDGDIEDVEVAYVSRSGKDSRDGSFIL